MFRIIYKLKDQHDFIYSLYPFEHVNDDLQVFIFLIASITFKRLDRKKRIIGDTHKNRF